MGNWPKVSIDMEKERDKCFVCGQNNPIGLKLSFRNEGGVARAEFTPDKLYQGWSGVLHGGITMALLDEAVSYAALFAGVNAITAKMDIRLRRLIPIGEPLSITGTIAQRKGKLVVTEGAIFLKDGTLAAEAKAKQFAVDARIKNSGNDKE
jgi:acyl-coenzyme A thioesterase PaaI-like protein